MPRSTYAVLATVALLLGQPGPARAQPDAAEQSAAARALFQQGVQHADRQEWTEAADRFRRAMELRPSPVIAFNLASALVHLNRLVEATEHLRFTVRLRDVNRNVRNSAQQLLEQIEPRLASLTVRLTGHPEGAEVRLDGEVMSTAVIGVAAPADPGHHRITAHHGGIEVAAGEVDLADGGTGEVTLDVPAPPAVPAPEDVVDPDRGSDRVAPLPAGGDRRDRGPDEGGSVLGQWWFWTIVAVAVAGGVTATVLLTAPEDPDPVQGTFMPGVLEVR